MNRGVPFFLILLDALCVVCGVWVAWLFWLWESPNLHLMLQVQFWDLWLPNPWMPAGLVAMVAWLFALRRLGMHDPAHMENSVRIASAVWSSAIYMAMFCVILNFLFADRVYPKSLLIPFLGGTWAILTLARLVVFRLLLLLPAPPTAARALIVGVDDDGLAMAERMARDARHVCAVAGHLRTGAEDQEVVPAERILGGVQELQAIVNQHDIQALILATRMLPRDQALKMAVQADRLGLRVLQAPYSWGMVSPRLGFARIGGLDLIDLVGIRYPTLGEQVKRGFDILAVLAGGMVLLPFLLVVALIVKLQDGGPILYGSERMGRGGRKFMFLKFRSMVVNADALRENLQQYNEADGRLFKMKNDPRVTPFGRFIRKYSVDEFPQLINVLRGDMNLVGPRPLPSKDLVGIESDSEMQYWFEQRSKVNPGITGLWQVSGRSNLGFADMVRLDIYYIQNWSLWLDFQILFKTIPAVLKGRGAM